MSATAEPNSHQLGSRMSLKSGPRYHLAGSQQRQSTDLCFHFVSTFGISTALGDSGRGPLHPAGTLRGLNEYSDRGHRDRPNRLTPTIEFTKFSSAKRFWVPHS
jgi:hypothetical protein